MSPNQTRTWQRCIWVEHISRTVKDKHLL